MSIRSSRVLVPGALIAMLPTAALAADPAGATPDWPRIGIGLFGGLALFLFGMDMMAKGLQAAAGESMKYVLSRLTANRFLGALTGAIVTAVLNSSSVTTVLVVGFVTAGLMSLAQSISVILGANIGSTFTAQIIAFDVSQYALLLVAVGFGMIFTAQGGKRRDHGGLVMGLGLIFYGMGVMGEAMAPLRSFPPFVDLMQRMEDPVAGILVGAAFTGLIQSSAATTGIAIVLASEGLVTLEAGIALVLGSNIGTCVTAVLAALGKPVDAKRAAAVHVLFNVIGVLLWVGFIQPLATLVTWISPSHPELGGSERMAAEVPRQIANAHTVFNVANTLLFLGFTGALARLVQRLIPDRPEDEDHVIVRPKYLDPELVKTPALALERVRLEIGHLGEITETMLSEVEPALQAGNAATLDRVEKMDDRVDILHRKILEYMGQIRQGPLTEAESDDFLALLTISDWLESVGDVIEVEMVHAGRKTLDAGVPATTPRTRQLLGRLYDAVSAALSSAVVAARDNDEIAAQDVLAHRSTVNRTVDDLFRRQAERIAAADPQRPTIFRLEMQIVDSLKRIYTLSKRVAQVVLPRELPETPAT